MKQPNDTERSPLLPSDQFDLLLSTSLGHPNGGHTPAAVVQDVDFYGRTTQFIVQTVRGDLGVTVFVSQLNSAGANRFILPSKVLALIDRQREAVTTQIRRRHGKRLAEQRGLTGAPVFTPEQLAKARATRQRNAAKRKKR